MEFDQKWLKSDGSTAYLAGKIICDAIGSLASSPFVYGNYQWVFDATDNIKAITSKINRLKLARLVLDAEISRLESENVTD